MTIKEITYITNANQKTIRKKIKELYPELMKKGIKTVLNDEQSTKILMTLKKTGLIEVGKSTEQVGKSTEVSNDRIDRLENMVEKLIQSIPLIVQSTLSAVPQTTPQQLEYKQDYFTLKGYCIYKGIEMPTVSELRIIGKDASRLSRSKDIDIKKESDSSYGYVNSYFIDILNVIFEF